MDLSEIPEQRIEIARVDLPQREESNMVVTFTSGIFQLLNFNSRLTEKWVDRRKASIEVFISFINNNYFYIHYILHCTYSS